MFLQASRNETGYWLADAPDETRPGPNSLYDEFHQIQSKNWLHEYIYTRDPVHGIRSQSGGG